MMRALCFALAVAAIAAPATAGSPCTQETLNVQGSPVTIVYCVTGSLRANGAEEVVVPVAATYSAPEGSLRRSLNLRFVAGEGVSRVLESLDLTKVGLTGTLHLTLAYSRGMVHIEGALLTPGAITIK